MTIYMHCYDASPFTQRALCMLGIKQLEWQFVETPMIPPKDDLVALTGGYRGTPVMQIGADVYLDTQRIAAELEHRFPAPTLFPGGDAGLGFLAVKWSDTFFRAGLPVAIELTSASWPAPFLADRKALFPHVDFDAACAGTAPERAVLRWHAQLLDRQLADGRKFLTADAPGLADAQVYPSVWMARSYFADVARELFAPFAHMAAWEERMRAVGQGTRRVSNAADAMRSARDAEVVPSSGFDAHDPLRLEHGTQVDVEPDDTLRGGVRGKLVALNLDEIAVSRHHPRTGDIVVHFPRMGYRVTRA